MLVQCKCRQLRFSIVHGPSTNPAQYLNLIIIIKLIQLIQFSFSLTSGLFTHNKQFQDVLVLQPPRKAPWMRAETLSSIYNQVRLT